MGCIYCEENEVLLGMMTPLGELPMSRVYLFLDQTYYGRCVVACKKHADELFQLSDEDRDAYMKDVAAVAAAVSKAVNAEKINLGMYGDKVKHVHFHVVPKQVDGPGYGGTFEMSCNPPRHLSPEEYQEMIDKIRAYL
ncbi:MAG TPA: HIT domain-containing protein [Candidatus Blautia gallistercoris]|uniref:HIT domain-containing protein n=1 Tax=Candidatus Blautia gallistercoris TaxID=2838490 RepID=A0A9D1WHX6_9FIRM|nr:HIT domain-containing protein [Candidatus Blautia gallistercoris]